MCEGPSFEDYKFQHAKVTPKSPELIDSSVPGWLDDVIMKAVRKDPERRWESVNEILEIFDEEMKD